MITRRDNQLEVFLLNANPVARPPKFVERSRQFRDLYSIASKNIGDYLTFFSGTELAVDRPRSTFPKVVHVGSVFGLDSRDKKIKLPVKSEQEIFS